LAVTVAPGELSRATSAGALNEIFNFRKGPLGNPRLRVLALNYRSDTDP
jgi:hypothetical protein